MMEPVAGADVVGGFTVRSGLARWVACAALALGVVAPGVGHADECKAAQMTGESHVDPATGAFHGVGTMVLGANVLPITWVSVVMAVTGNADGTLALVSSHHIMSDGDGGIDLTTADAVSAVPTGVAGEYVFSSHLIITSGRGRLKSGWLDVTGRVNLVSGDVILDGSEGSLCSR
jgi:hypothetical protein